MWVKLSEYEILRQDAQVQSFSFARWKSSRDLLHNSVNILNTTEKHLMKMVNLMLCVFLPQRLFFFSSLFFKGS